MAGFSCRHRGAVIVFVWFLTGLLAVTFNQQEYIGLRGCRSDPSNMVRDKIHARTDSCGRISMKAGPSSGSRSTDFGPNSDGMANKLPLPMPAYYSGVLFGATLAAVCNFAVSGLFAPSAEPPSVDTPSAIELGRTTQKTVAPSISPEVLESKPSVRHPFDADAAPPHASELEWEKPMRPSTITGGGWEFEKVPDGDDDRMMQVLPAEKPDVGDEPMMQALMELFKNLEKEGVQLEERPETQKPTKTDAESESLPPAKSAKLQGLEKSPEAAVPGPMKY